MGDIVRSGVLSLLLIVKHLIPHMEFSTPIMRLILGTKLDHYQRDNKLMLFKCKQGVMPINADIVAIPGIQIATGTLCGQAAYSFYQQCEPLTVACLVPAAGQTHVTAQQLILDSMGNGWG